MKPTFNQIGTMLQETAKTREEADKRFRDSCERCYKAGRCNEKLCPIAKMHESRLLYLEAEELVAKVPVKVEFVKTRKYTVSPEIRMRRKVVRYLDSYVLDVKAYHFSRQEIIALDNASVRALEGRYEDCCNILKSAKLLEILGTVEDILKGGINHETYNH